jgi:hypothetical protein
MSKRITIDPITRIEGHLRIDCEVGDDNKVSAAWASGTMWRGVEQILLGRDPRDAWAITQRFCGVCTTVHAIASVRAVENALDLGVPKNAQYIRNLMIAAHAVHDEIVHFYHLSALDWVDVTSALKADPVKASQLGESLSSWPGNGKNELTAVHAKLKTLVESGQLGIFANGYWGHPAMKLPPEVNLLAVAHYLQALDVQRKANKIVAILGSKTPHIQNVAVGGVSNAISLNSQSVLSVERLLAIKEYIEAVKDFVQNVYLVDVAAVAAFYPEWTTIGKGVTNYLAAPDFPLDEKGTTYGGLIRQVYPDLKITHIHHAGNSSGVVDGAAAVLLASPDYAKKNGLKPRARVVAMANVGDSPTLMLNAPVPAARKVLDKAGLTIDDIDLFEINEAFAVVAEKFIRDLKLDRDKVNVNGGAMALGHPIGATGSILIGTILDELERRDLKRGLVTMCAAGGMAPAIIIERM